MKIVDITGQRFGRLIVIAKTDKRASGCVMWKCVCNCGNITEVRSDKLKSEHTQSCGCLQRERVIEASTTHGHRSGGKFSPTYVSWVGMKQRCNDSKKDNYKYYGGRGIIICDEWQTSFVDFLNDMGERPVGKTIDRIDPNGNYERSNCRWATMSQQYMNKRR